MSWYFDVFKGTDTNQGIICHSWGTCSLTIIDMVVLAFDGSKDNVGIEMSNPSMEWKSCLMSQAEGDQICTPPMNNSEHERS
jgi:hypothetical protein